MWPNQEATGPDSSPTLPLRPALLSHFPYPSAARLCPTYISLTSFLYCLQHDRPGQGPWAQPWGQPGSHLSPASPHTIHHVTPAFPSAGHASPPPTSVFPLTIPSDTTSSRKAPLTNFLWAGLPQPQCICCCPRVTLVCLLVRLPHWKRSLLGMRILSEIINNNNRNDVTKKSPLKKILPPTCSDLIMPSFLCRKLSLVMVSVHTAILFYREMYPTCAV